MGGGGCGIDTSLDEEARCVWRTMAKIKTTFVSSARRQRQTLRENHCRVTTRGLCTNHYRTWCGLHSWLQNTGQNHQCGTTRGLHTNHGHAWYAVHSQLHGKHAPTATAARYPAARGCPGLASLSSLSPLYRLSQHSMDTPGSRRAGLPL